MRNAYEGRSNGHTHARGEYEDRNDGGRRAGRGAYEDEQEMYAFERSRTRDTMGHTSLVKVIEVLAESDRSWEDAANMALREASRTIRNIKSIYVKDMQAICRDGRIVCYRLNAKISFGLEPDRDEGRWEDTDRGEERYGRY